MLSITATVPQSSPASLMIGLSVVVFLLKTVATRDKLDESEI